MSRYDDPAVREALAAEYVLGTLRGSARRRFERLLGQRADWRREVEQWSARLAGLAAAVPAREPPASVWEGIQARVKPATRARGLRWWQSLAAFASLAAVVLAVALFVVPSDAPAQHTAVLKDTEGRAGWVVAVSATRVGGADIRVAVEGARAIPGRAFELWVLPAGAAPISLGLLPAQREARLPVRAGTAALLQSGTALAVSVEPPGGSPTGQPTGPVTHTCKLI